MFHIQLDHVTFSLKENHDFSWLSSLGTVFAVFDQNDSGNISFGVKNDDGSFFIKVAGLAAINSLRTKEENVLSLKEAMNVYENIQHPHLIQLVKYYAINDLYVAIFKWVDGDCLFDHWNFTKYEKNPQLLPPSKRFRQLPLSQRVKLSNILFSFLETVSDSGYVAVDFYDGSIIYDFQNDLMTICDIDLFRKKPAWNDIGKDYWGTKRLKAPEEYQYGASIDEITNIYTLGALLFDSFFGNYTELEIQKRYQECAFAPCSPENWELNSECYRVARKAVNKNRNERYSSILEFYKEWQRAINTL